MTDLMAELAAQSKWLRKVAAEIATEGHYGWGNTCLFAAESIDKAHAEIEAMARDAARYRWLRGLESQFMLKRYGCGDLPMEDDLDEAIDAMRDSAREDGDE